ncbi:hypothetical protein SARC_10311 [Sphaeroforma arctica JP610]|uniref:C2H2-type domain-containing protein n=1 Tax=Sphaeroforma arctica JP610 TaxID=667725 RepID=A0A0L0FMG7_9EUKA|nr:hypothetical protein SARC_10311 [Sphaeroforma arctica JP610]KNC77223.1 hypothetical protein SARC_10311 [Sphaeroforma arctica JP610]|eukprot:XP_014151125.1 hypothetical protein SARC_10311 [Sphaeroforma arctica JP610]
MPQKIKNSTAEVAHDILVSADDNGHFERIESFKRRARKTYSEAERPYKCEFCTRSYAFEHSRNQHIRLKHIPSSLKSRTNGAQKEATPKASKSETADATRSSIRVRSLTDVLNTSTNSALSKNHTTTFAQAGIRKQMRPQESNTNNQLHRVDVENDVTTDQFVGVSGVPFRPVSYHSLSPSATVSMSTGENRLPWRGADSSKQFGPTGASNRNSNPRPVCNRRASDITGIKTPMAHPYRCSFDGSNNNRLDDLLDLHGHQQRVRQRSVYSHVHSSNNIRPALRASQSCEVLRSKVVPACNNQVFSFSSFDIPQSYYNMKTLYRNASTNLPTHSEPMQSQALAQLSNSQRSQEQAGCMARSRENRNTADSPAAVQDPSSKPWMSIYNTFLVDKDEAHANASMVQTQADSHMVTLKSDRYIPHSRTTREAQSAELSVRERSMGDTSAEDDINTEEDGNGSSGCEGRSSESRSTLGNDSASSACPPRSPNYNQFTSPSHYDSRNLRAAANRPAHDMTDIESIIELSTDNVRNNRLLDAKVKTTWSSVSSIQEDNAAAVGRRLPSDMNVDFVCSILKSLESA